MAKFVAGDVKELFIKSDGTILTGEVTLTLRGETTDDEPFIGLDTVNVINIIPKKR